MINWDYFEFYKRFGRVFEMVGIDVVFNVVGVGEGDCIIIGDFEFEWSKDCCDCILYEFFR